MSQKVLYFTVGPKPTVDEAAEIAKLNELAVPIYEVIVCNGAVDANYGAGRLVPHDFVAGTIPTAYEESDVLDPDALVPGIGDGDSAVVYNGQTIDVTGGTVTLTVAAGVVTAAFTADP